MYAQIGVRIRAPARGYRGGSGAADRYLPLEIDRAETLGEAPLRRQRPQVLELRAQDFLHTLAAGAGVCAWGKGAEYVINGQTQATHAQTPISWSTHAGQMLLGKVAETTMRCPKVGCESHVRHNGLRTSHVTCALKDANKYRAMENMLRLDWARLVLKCSPSSLPARGAAGSDGRLLNTNPNRTESWTESGQAP